ncbi:MAG TPA: hypothetical protein VLD37_05750 [Candidatus Bilamarchaeum sp.]|nr:hypothetical protein [Candidatus Bilamarchaeum sp.]
MSADGKPPRPLEPHPEFRTALKMLNSIRVLGPDMKQDEKKTREARLQQFGKIKHVMEDYEFCEATGRVIRVR